MIAEFVCPRCRGELDSVVDAHHCRGCDATYPTVLGIPDFRVEPDPWIGLEEDRAKAQRLIAETDGMDLAASVAAYWAMTPTTAPELAQRFTSYVLSGERRAAEWLDRLDAPTSDRPWLEIGCASGDLLSVCAARGIRAVGVDVAMRWLVLARKRPALANAPQPLVCANAEHLPFRDAWFGRMVSVGTLEHCRDAEAVLRESARVLEPHAGDAVLRTTNRYSLLSEPHVDLWGVGFVPRARADAYVRWRGGQGYAHHHPLSAGELGRGMRAAGFVDVSVTAARMLESDRARLGGAGGIAAPVYDVARATPLVASAVSWIAPLLEARGRAG